MGGWSLGIAGLTILAALFEIALGGTEAGGEMGGFWAIPRAITMARIGFGIGAILSLVGLWHDDMKRLSIAGLVLNGGAEIGLAVCVGLWWFW